MPLREMGRLAFREEGENWNVYYALSNTMKDAIFLASIKLKFVQRQERKDGFIEFMRQVFGDICEEKFGHRPEWKDPRPAPEHERTKE